MGMGKTEKGKKGKEMVMKGKSLNKFYLGHLKVSTLFIMSTQFMFYVGHSQSYTAQPTIMGLSNYFVFSCWHVTSM